MVRVRAGIEDALSLARSFRANFRSHLPYPVGDVPRARHPRERNDLAQRGEQRPPARRHLAVAVDLDRTQHGFRKADARARELDQILRPLHGRRQPAQHFLFELAQRLQPRMRFAREIDSGIPYLFERAHRGAHHAGERLDRLELAELHRGKRIAHGDFQIVGIDRAQQPAGKPRGELAHGENLHAALAGTRGMHARHVPGEPGVYDDGAAQRHEMQPSPTEKRQAVPRSRHFTNAVVLAPDSGLFNARLHKARFCGPYLRQPLLWVEPRSLMQGSLSYRVTLLSELAIRAGTLSAPTSVP